MVRFTLKQCTYFIAVSRHGGISQAARALNISQPSVAQALDKLEAITGLVLFERHHARGLDLTAQGRSFLTHVQKLMEDAAQVEREAALLRTGRAGEIRLGCFHTIAQFHLARLLHEFAAADPQVRVAASELPMDQLTGAVAEGGLDMAIVYEIAPGLEALQVTVLADLTPHIILPETHALAGRKSIHLAELNAEPFVMFEGPGSRPYFESLLARHGLSPEIAFSSDAIESVRSAVGNGFGFSLLALKPMHDRTYDGRRLVCVPIADRVEGIKILLATRSDLRKSPVMSRFAAQCLAYFSKLDTGDADAAEKNSPRRAGDQSSSNPSNKAVDK